MEVWYLIDNSTWAMSLFGFSDSGLNKTTIKSLSFLMGKEIWAAGLGQMRQLCRYLERVRCGAADAYLNILSEILKTSLGRFCSTLYNITMIIAACIRHMVSYLWQIQSVTLSKLSLEPTDFSMRSIHLRQN